MFLLVECPVVDIWVVGLSIVVSDVVFWPVVDVEVVCSISVTVVVVRRFVSEIEVINSIVDGVGIFFCPVVNIGKEDSIDVVICLIL